MKIKTNYDPKPIPLRQFDWAAWDDDTLDYDSQMGWGATEEAAIADLQEKTLERTEQTDSPSAA